MSLLEAVDRSVGAMSGLSDADAALVEACRTLAEQLDTGRKTAGLWQQFLASLRDLAERGVEGEAEDGGDAVVLALSTAVGDRS